MEPERGLGATEDTVIIDARGYEVVTKMADWPAIEVAVKGYVIPRPGILGARVARGGPFAARRATVVPLRNAWVGRSLWHPAAGDLNELSS